MLLRRKTNVMGVVVDKLATKRLYISTATNAPDFHSSTCIAVLCPAKSIGVSVVQGCRCNTLYLGH